MWLVSDNWANHESAREPVKQEKQKPEGAIPLPLVNGLARVAE